MTRDGTTTKFYVNGIQTSGTSTSTPGTVASRFSIGMEYSTSDVPTAFYAGGIDGVRFYNYTLAQTQISYNFDRGLPIGWWQFDECQGTTAYDAGSGGNNGTITITGAGDNTSPGTCGSGVGTEAWNNGTTGKINYSLDFDGTDDTVNTTSLPTTATTNISMSAWVNWDGTNAASQLLLYNGASGSNGYGIIISDGACGSGTEIEVLLGGTTCDAVSSNTTLSTGTWTHVVLTRGNSTWTLYVNGVAKHTGTTNPITPTGVFNIGINSFDGQIDDVRFYNYALSAAQIRKVMNDGSAVRYGPVTGHP